jgi:hypothetical protein
VFLFGESVLSPAQAKLLLLLLLLLFPAFQEHFAPNAAGLAARRR